MICLRFLFFFFFKQKTAYEMRISDWSSDVCSSDLLPLAGAQGLLQALQDAQVGLQFGEPPLLLQRRPQAFQIAAGIVHVGLLHHHVVQPAGGVELDGARHGPLATHLLEDLALGLRPEERRVGNGCGSTVWSWWAP